MPKTNMTFIRGNESLPTDELFQSDNMIKVRFPVNAQSKARGIGSERMWVEVLSGTAKDGVGEINNVPAFSDFNLGDLISYELNEEDGVYYFGKLIKKKVTDFTTDWEKMRDFHKLTKEEFLKSYSYLTESEYDATAKIVKRG